MNADQLKMYDSMRGTERWPAGRGYGTVSGASVRKSKSSANWSNVFTTWKKKGKKSETKKTTCHEAFAFQSGGSVSGHKAVTSSQAVLLSPPLLDPAIFCSLSSASGHHYLSNSNHYKFTGSPCDARCQQVPCISSATTKAASISRCSYHQPGVSGVTGRRGSLFAPEWDSHQQVHSLRCTCQHASPQSAHTSFLHQTQYQHQPQSSQPAFTSRYKSCSHPMDGVTDVHSTSDQHQERVLPSHRHHHPHHHNPHEAAFEFRAPHEQHSIPSINTSPQAAAVNNNKKSSSSSSASGSCIGTVRTTCASSAYKKSAKHSACTISGAFVRSLRRTSSREDHFNSLSGRKSILNSGASAYDLIRRQIDQEERDAIGEDSDNELFCGDDSRGENGIQCRQSSSRRKETAKKQKTPLTSGEQTTRSRTLISSSCRPKSEYLSKNMRIAGQGVTLFPCWEEPLHKSASSATTTTTTTASTTSRQDAKPSRKQHPPVEKEGIAVVILEEEEEEEETCGNIPSPEPDYDLSDGDDDDPHPESVDLSSAGQHYTQIQSVANETRSDIKIPSDRPVTKSILKRMPEKSDPIEKDSGGQSKTGPEAGDEVTQGNMERTKYRKSAIGCLMKLKFNKRNHRKHVTFRSHNDDPLFLEHINEPIPEEDETLYDDVASDHEEEDENPVEPDRLISNQCLDSSHGNQISQESKCEFELLI